MLHFLNKLDVVGYLESYDYEKFNCNKNVLTDEVQDVNSEKLINMLVVIDDLYDFFITRDFHDVQILINVSRGDIFSLLTKRM